MLVRVPAAPANKILFKVSSSYHKEKEMGKTKVTPNKTAAVIAFINDVFFKTDSRIFAQKDHGKIIAYIETMQERIKELEMEVAIYKRMGRDNHE